MSQPHDGDGADKAHEPDPSILDDAFTAAAVVPVSDAGLVDHRGSPTEHTAPKDWAPTRTSAATLAPPRAFELTVNGTGGTADDQE